MKKTSDKLSEASWNTEVWKQPAGQFAVQRSAICDCNDMFTAVFWAQSALVFFLFVCSQQKKMFWFVWLTVSFPGVHVMVFDLHAVKQS